MWAGTCGYKLTGIDKIRINWPIWAKKFCFDV